VRDCHRRLSYSEPAVAVERLAAHLAGHAIRPVIASRCGY